MHLPIFTTARKDAVSRAVLQNGPGYKYWTQSVSVYSNSNKKQVSALVYAYNDSTYKTLEINWTE